MSLAKANSFQVHYEIYR